MNYLLQKLTFTFFCNKWFIMFFQLFFGGGRFLSTYWRHFYFHRKILHNQWRCLKSFLRYCGSSGFLNQITANVHPFLMTDFPQYQTFHNNSPLYVPSQQWLKSIYREPAGNVQCSLFPQQPLVHGSLAQFRDLIQWKKMELSVC